MKDKQHFWTKKFWQSALQSNSPEQQQMSDAFGLYLLLALSGGSMDAYSYLFRGKVFANAQTGNVLLMAVHLAGREWKLAGRYATPILAFVAGIILADWIRHYVNREYLDNWPQILEELNPSWHWRQCTVLLEIIALSLACIMPLNLNFLANMLSSFACGLQVESFRALSGRSIATTMCIGNMRSGTYYLDRYWKTGDGKYLIQAIVYYAIILFFALGAVIESILIAYFGAAALLFSVVILIIVALLMFL